MLEDKIIQELSDVVQSSNVNFLFGAGTSTPFLPVLGNIEQKLNSAKDFNEKEMQYKEYLNRVMLPNKKVVRGEPSPDFDKTKKSYQDFFLALGDMLMRRKSTILSKQINLFTSNIDILIETCLEELKMEYNDGFSGKFNPIFGLANFKKSIHQRSLHFEHSSEMPVINIIKIHGSLTWKVDSANDKIVFSRDLEHIEDGIETKTGVEFDELYRKILVVNPEETKHLESVLNLYYSELLRLYSSELEKENASLFVVGFSMEDKHIREITLRSAKSNPTLRIFICCSVNKVEMMSTKMEIEKHSNIQILSSESEETKFTLDYFNSSILSKVTSKRIREKNDT